MSKVDNFQVDKKESTVLGSKVRKFNQSAVPKGTALSARKAVVRPANFVIYFQCDNFFKIVTLLTFLRKSKTRVHRLGRTSGGLYVFMRIEKYLEWKANHAPRASVAYRIWIERFVSWTGKDVDTAEIGDIVAYQKMLEKKYQPKSIELAMVILKNYFKFWKLTGLDCVSPDLVKIPRTVPNSHQAVSFEEYCSMLSFIHPTTFWELQKLVILRLLFETGIRVSELCDLNISDIDPKKMNTVIRTKKTAHVRKIFWSVETHIFVREFLVQRKEKNSTPAFFVGRFIDGTPTKRMTTRTVQRMIKELSCKAKIEKKISPHSFRHGKAHRVLELGGNPKDVQAILGHCDPTSSFTYLQWNDREFEARAQAFLPCG